MEEMLKLKERIYLDDKGKAFLPPRFRMTGVNAGPVELLLQLRDVKLAGTLLQEYTVLKL